MGASVTFWLFSRTDLEVRPPNQFSRKMAQTTWIHEEMCLLGYKSQLFKTPWPSDPQNRQSLPNFGRDLENFRSISLLTLGVSWVNTPYSSSELNKILSAIVNRQCGGEKLKYVIKFYIGGYRSRDIAHAQWRFALVRHFGAEYLENSDWDRGSVSIDH